MKIILVLLLAIVIFPARSFAKDINFIDSSQLPKTVLRSYEEQWHGSAMQVPAGYGIDKAMESTDAEEQCMAKVGRQLTDWTSETSEVAYNYWHYSISATFECLPPKLSGDINGEAAKNLFQDMKGLTSTVSSGIQEKAATVLCYSGLDEVCRNGVLHGYHDRYTCELHNLHDVAKMVRLDDILDDEASVPFVIQDQGARRLTADLPIYLDRRRDDVPGANCGGHIPGQLKGLMRQAAIVHCFQSNIGLGTTCHIEGMIRTTTPDSILAATQI